MIGITFSSGISDTTQKITQQLYDWMYDASWYGTHEARNARDPVIQEKFAAYIQDGMIDLQSRDVQLGDSLLHYAAGYDCPIVLKALIENGMSTDTMNLEGESVLATAFGNDALDQVGYLLDQGANIHTSRRLVEKMTNDAKDVMIEHVPLLKRYENAVSTWNAWKDSDLGAENLTHENILQMLSVWPISEAKAEVPRFAHLETIFSDARWKDEHAEHKRNLIGQISGLSSREQMFLMGGHARALIQRQGTGIER